MVAHREDGIMNKEAKSVECWREDLDRDATGGRGRFHILSRAMFNSRAFVALGGPGIIVVLSILNKLEYEKKGRKDRKGVKTGLPILRNNGEFCLTINELIARGLSKSTATRARFLAWELGFFDVMESGTVHHAGKYRYSERWRNYPDGDYRPVGQQPPGKNIYPESNFKGNENNQSDKTVDGRRGIFSDYLKVVK
jgi:hypothetical protein